jgi:hypothetical protein
MLTSLQVVRWCDVGVGGQKLLGLGYAEHNGCAGCYLRDLCLFTLASLLFLFLLLLVLLLVLSLPLLHGLNLGFLLNLAVGAHLIHRMYVPRSGLRWCA